MKRSRRRFVALPFTGAPLFHALQLQAIGDAARFHMPGHKGEPLFTTFSSVFAIDFTETYGTGNLYEGTGPIREAEQAAARYFGAPDCFFLTDGSTQGVKAMLAAACGTGSGVLLDRGCHRSACHACALLDLTPYFFEAPLIEPFGIGGELSLAAAEAQLAAHPDIRAVLITSPTYYGIIRDIPALADLCHRTGKKLLVDAAHGAHFPAVGLPTPVQQGADMAVLSIHKTLPALGQSALLLVGDGLDNARLRECTALFGTSSPSYPIMASADLARAYMEGTGAPAYVRSSRICRSLRQFINHRTRFSALFEDDFPALDPCRLTVCTAGTDVTGTRLADMLWSEFGVACEMADARNVVFILTGADTGSMIRRLKNGLRRLSNRREPTIFPVPALPAMPEAARVLRVREAFFAPCGKVSIAAAAGMICARPVTPYPPGVPVLWPGEKITAEFIATLSQKWYNEIDQIEVVIPKTQPEGGISP